MSIITKSLGKSLLGIALCLALTPALYAESTASSTDASSHSAKKPAHKSSAKKTTTKKSSSAKEKSTKKTSSAKVRSDAIRQARTNVSVDRAVATPGIQSAGALILNEQTGEVIYEKNADNIVPIASITKLMTAMVTLDAHLPLNELITVRDEDVDTLKNTGSRLSVGTTLTRGEMLLLALMSSENRAASVLSHNYPGGRDAFVRKMNEKAQELGMRNSRFYDPTGLTPHNVSTARELSLMVKAAERYAEIHQFTTSSEYSFTSNLSGRVMTFRNTNPLVKDDNWQIGVSKTGFINEAGRCIVMQARISDTPVVMVLMDSNGKYTRIGDAQRVRKWLETSPYAKLKDG